jgi:heme/copper-type cytochrome/quinol oxidase subunit 2
MRKRFNRLFFISGLISAAIAFLPLEVKAETGEVIIRVEASQFAYSPAVVDVRLGQKVILELTSLDVVHGLYLDGYDLEVSADPGQRRRLSFEADRSGTYRFRCSVTCGPLHPFMIGQLRVQPYPKIRLIALGGLSALFFGLTLALRHNP